MSEARSLMSGSATMGTELREEITDVKASDGCDSVIESACEVCADVVEDWPPMNCVNTDTVDCATLTAVMASAVVRARVSSVYASPAQ